MTRVVDYPKIADAHLGSRVEGGRDEPPQHLSFHSGIADGQVHQRQHHVDDPSRRLGIVVGYPRQFGSQFLQRQ
jgi:hypothetical protein